MWRCHRCWRVFRPGMSNMPACPWKIENRSVPFIRRGLVAVCPSACSCAHIKILTTGLFVCPPYTLLYVQIILLPATQKPTSAHSCTSARPGYFKWDACAHKQAHSLGAGTHTVSHIPPCCMRVHYAEAHTHLSLHPQRDWQCPSFPTNYCKNTCTRAHTRVRAPPGPRASAPHALSLISFDTLLPAVSSP